MNRKREIMERERDQGVEAQELRRESQRIIKEAENQYELEAADRRCVADSVELPVPTCVCPPRPSSARAVGPRRKRNDQKARAKSRDLQVEIASSSELVHAGLKDNHGLFGCCLPQLIRSLHQPCHCCRRRRRRGCQLWRDAFSLQLPLAPQC